MNEGTTDPFSVWGSMYSANVEFWSKAMAEMINSEAVAQSMGDYLDNYLASSEPLRKIAERYMEFWLTSMNMPTRDEMMQLLDRTGQIEARLLHLGTQAGGAPLSAPASVLPPALSELEAKVDRLIQTVGSQASANDVAGVQADQVRELEQRVDALTVKTEQILELLQRHIAQSNEVAAPPTQTSLADRVQLLDEKASELLQAVQRLTNGAEQ